MREYPQRGTKLPWSFLTMKHKKNTVNENDWFIFSYVCYLSWMYQRRYLQLKITVSIKII
jgi:hypothetical protein